MKTGLNQTKTMYRFILETKSLLFTHFGCGLFTVAVVFLVSLSSPKSLGSVNNKVLLNNNGKMLEDIMAKTPDFNAIDERILQVFGVDRAYAAHKLRELRIEVEREAYVKTMSLCEGYRRFTDLGPIPGLGHYLEKIHSSSYTELSDGHLSKKSGGLVAISNKALHPKEEMFFNTISMEDRRKEIFIQQKNLRPYLQSDGYYFSQMEHALSVLEVSKNGFMTSFETMGNGDKAQQIIAYDKSFFEPTSLYGSVFLHYLLRSQGGHRAMVHCIGYDKRGDFRADRLSDFMNYVGLIDGSSGVVADTVLGGAVAGVFLKLVLKPILQYVVRPIIGLVGRTSAWAWVSRLSSKLWYSAPGKIFVVGSGVVSVDSLIVHYQEKIRQMDAIKAKMETEGLGSFFKANRLEQSFTQVRSLAIGYMNYLRMYRSFSNGEDLYTEEDLAERKEIYDKFLNIVMVKNSETVIELCRALHEMPDKPKEVEATLGIIFGLMPQVDMDPKLCTSPQG